MTKGFLFIRVRWKGHCRASCSVMQCYDNMTVHLTGYQIDGGRSRIRVYCYTNPYFGVSCAAMGWKSMEMMIHHFLGRRGPNNP